jgi:hypothetical protein
VITKHFIRQNIGAVAGYNAKAIRDHDAIVLYSNVASKSAHEIERELDAWASTRPRVLQPGIHLVIALHPSDEPIASDLLFLAILQEYRQRFGLTESQTVVWRHFDKPHPHIHCLMNRVTTGGSVVPMWNLRSKLKKFQFDMEKLHGLQCLDETDFKQIHPELTECLGRYSSMTAIPEVRPEAIWF